jgi:hypothetical protein
LETIINSIPQIPLYVHPAISEHVHALGTVTTLEDLFENLKSWKDAGSSQKHFLIEDLDTRSRYPYMHSVLLRWFKEGDRNKILMTEPYDSDLKNGSVKFVCNLRYLEFLRDKRGELKIFTKGTKDYIIAIGKSYPRNWHPTCAELYLFDVTKYDKDTINLYT